MTFFLFILSCGRNKPPSLIDGIDLIRNIYRVGEKIDVGLSIASAVSRGAEKSLFVSKPDQLNKTGKKKKNNQLKHKDTWNTEEEEIFFFHCSLILDPEAAVHVCAKLSQQERV